jgi:hypothetical protein
MSKQLVTDFLVELSINPDMLARFQRDPAGTVSAAGFSAKEAQLLISRDPEAIREFLGSPARGVAPNSGRPKKKKPAKKRAKKPAKKK